ncbi:lysoplasmalogenase family protein [Tomitella gaofuii]|uniref:lysoplasmalogenase family protein n=1 Tax=Tomitella gaofuii TaxID=2760083 RepID=UPI0015FC4D35|nr:lysoplasmalogenase family protein [Tomitella gaofuii]
MTRGGARSVLRRVGASLRGSGGLHPEHGVYLAGALATTALALTGDKRIQYATKTTLGPALAARVLRERRAGAIDGVDTALLLIGLAGATAGDVFMIDADDDERLRRGASAFGVMQSAYGQYLRQHGAKPRLKTALVGGASAAAGAALLHWRMPQVASTLSGYSLALGTTATLAADPGLAPGAPRIADVVRPDAADTRTWLGAGGMLFTVSDAAIVGRRMFLRGAAARRLAEGFVIASYGAAHLMLVEGMLALRRR